MSTVVRLPDGAGLAVTDLGDGPDVLLLVQTALTADELLPVAQQPALAGWRRVLPHRRGYDASDIITNGTPARTVAAKGVR